MQQVKLPTGAVIAYDEFDCTDPWLAPEPLVLIHGFSKHRRFWYEWVPRLCRRYRVFCPDLRGHGDSTPWPEGAPFSLAPFTDDLAAFIGALGLGAAHVVAAEFSSSIAIELAASRPGLVRSLVFPGFGYNWKAGAVDPKSWARLIAEEGVAAWARKTNADRLPPGADPALRAWYIGQQARMPAPLMQALFHFAAELDLTDRLPSITAPSLIIGGAQARQDTAESLRRAVQLMPDARLVILDGMPFNVMTAAPEACIEATLGFLAGL